MLSGSRPTFDVETEMISKPRVKISCIQSRAEAKMAIEAGAHALGLVPVVPDGPGTITEGQIAHIVAHVPPAISTFLLTCRNDVKEIAYQARISKVDTIQLCTRLSLGDYACLRREIPSVSLVQAVKIQDRNAMDAVHEVASFVDAVQLEFDSDRGEDLSEMDGLVRSQLLATCAEIKHKISTPVFLSGGLTAENVVEAVLKVQPYGIDVCNGVRTENRLDDDKLKRFMASLGAL